MFECRPSNDFDAETYDEFKDKYLVITTVVTLDTPTYDATEAEAIAGFVTGKNAVGITGCSNTYDRKKRRKRETYDYLLGRLFFLCKISEKEL